MIMTLTQQLEDTKQKLLETQSKLTEFQSELPTFEKLVTDNEAIETEIRQRKVSLDELSAAKLRSISARELLEQHEEDIEKAEEDIKALSISVKDLERLVKIEAIENELSTLQGEYKKDLTKALETTLKTFKALAAKRDRWQELRGVFRNEFAALAHTQWGIYDGVNDPDALDTKEKFSKGLKRLREAGLNPAVLLSMPDDTLGKYSSESLATYELTDRELRAIGNAAPTFFNNNGRTTFALAEMIELAGWIPDIAMYKAPR
jgi:chromosome segregation ATPase